MFSQQYIAPRPIQPANTWLGYFAWRFVFPPLLIWDLTQFVLQRCFGLWLGRKILEGQTVNRDAANLTDLAQKIRTFSRRNSLLEQSTVQTHDGAQLDTLTVIPFTMPQKFVICLSGNNQDYQNDIAYLVQESLDLDRCIVAFNYRGINRSTPAPSHKTALVTDAIAQVQRLLDANVLPENICLRGFSLGAGIAALTAEHFHAKNIRINVFCDRAFSTITNTIVGALRQSDSGHTETRKGKILGWLVKPIIKFILVATDWEIDTVSAYRRIPDQNKEYCVVRSSQRDRQADGESRKDDAIITHYASLHLALKPDRQVLKEKLRHLSTELQSAPALLRSDFFVAKSSVDNALQHLKQRKMVTNTAFENGHQSRLQHLYSRYNRQSGFSFFKEFLGRDPVDARHIINPAVPVKRVNNK